jgi:WD40 repeat protein
VSGECDSNTMRLWNAATGESVGSMEGRKGGSIGALPGGRFAIVGQYKNTASVWDTASRTRVCQLMGHTDSVNCVASLPGGLVATGSHDGTVRLWTAATGAQVDTLQHGGSVYALAMLPDGRLVSGGRGGTRLWDISNRACTAEWAAEDNSSSLSLAALEGGLLAIGHGDDGALYLWNTTSGVREAALEGHTGAVNILAALPRGLLASGGTSMRVRVWSVAARTCVAELRGYGLYGLAALADGRLASGSLGDDLICVWDVAHLNTGAPATAAETTGPPCPTCTQRTLGPLPGTGGTHLCFLCRHLIQ